MLKFPDNYFRDEVRDGFLVSEMMKRTWGSQLEIFDRVRNLCDKYGITYFAEVGTLLGAVRHKGIIPWDDDIDLAMRRADYMQFLEHANEIGDDLVVRSIYSSDSFYNLHAVVTHRADTLEWDARRMKDYHRCPFICAVDVFPLDYYPSDPQKFDIYTQLYCFSYKQLYDLVAYENTYFDGKLINYKELRSGEDSDVILEGIKALKGYLKANMGLEMAVDPESPLRNQLARITDRVAMQYDRADSDGLDYAPKLPLGGFGSRPAWSYDDKTELPFEMTTISVPAGYMEALASHYGSNFMIPVRGAAGHEYPFFKHEVNVLVGGDIGERYVFSPEKRYITDSLNILQEACGQLSGLIAEGKTDAAMNLLGQMQELTQEIGNYIENSCDNTDRIIDVLTEYCEEIYRVYKEIEEGVGAEGWMDENAEGGLAFANRLINGLQPIRRAVFREIHSELPDALNPEQRYVLLGISAAGVVNNSTYETSGIRKVIQEYIKDDGVRPIVAFSGGLEEFLRKTGLSVEKDYLRLLDEMRKDNRITLFEDPTSLETDGLLAVCDVYIGDECRLSQLCTAAGMTCRVTDWR